MFYLDRCLHDLVGVGFVHCSVYQPVWRSWGLQWICDLDAEKSFRCFFLELRTRLNNHFSEVVLSQFLIYCSVVVRAFMKSFSYPNWSFLNSGRDVRNNQDKWSALHVPNSWMTCREVTRLQRSQDMSQIALRICGKNKTRKVKSIYWRRRRSSSHTKNMPFRTTHCVKPHSRQQSIFKPRTTSTCVRSISLENGNKSWLVVEWLHNLHNKNNCTAARYALHTMNEDYSVGEKTKSVINPDTINKSSYKLASTSQSTCWMITPSSETGLSFVSTIGKRLPAGGGRNIGSLV